LPALGFDHEKMAKTSWPVPGEDHWMVISKHKELGELTSAFLVEHAGGPQMVEQHLADGRKNR
jgi:hypothetical protein